MAPAPTNNLAAALQDMEGLPPPVNSLKKIEKLPCNKPRTSVTSYGETSYVENLCEMFRPSPEQVQQARNWLVRVIARRAVEILNTQEEAEGGWVF